MARNNVSLVVERHVFPLLFQWVSTIKIRLRVLVYYKANIIIISWKLPSFRHDYHSCNVAHLPPKNTFTLLVFSNTCQIYTISNMSWRSWSGIIDGGRCRKTQRPAASLWIDTTRAQVHDLQHNSNHWKQKRLRRWYANGNEDPGLGQE